MKCRNKNKNKLSVKQKVALACFMEGLPKLIELWHNDEEGSSLPFDVFLMRIYENKQQNKSPPITDERS